MDFYNFLSNEWRPSQNISGIKVSSVTWTQHGASKSCSDTQRTEGYIDAASYVSAAFLNQSSRRAGWVLVASCPTPTCPLPPGADSCSSSSSSSAVNGRIGPPRQVPFSHGRHYPASAYVPLVHGGHLFGRFCFPLRADSRWASHLLPLPAGRTHLLMLTLTSLVSLLARNISGALAVARGTWSRAHFLLPNAAQNIVEINR